MKTQDKIKKTKIKCYHCEYKWTTKSDMQFVSCPNCLNKVINKNKTTEVVKQQKDDPVIIQDQDKEPERKYIPREDY